MSARAANAWETGIETEIGFPQEDFCQEDAVEIRTREGASICYAVCNERTRNMIVATPEVLAALEALLAGEDSVPGSGKVRILTDAATLEAARDAVARARGRTR